jgi:LPS export ABC transporter protein LptC
MKINQKKNKKNRFLLFSFLFALFSLLLTCTFDYGEAEIVDDDHPDLVMINVEYVRVRDRDPIAKFQAERAERYEKQGVMKLENFTFEQYGERGTEVNATGEAGYAMVEIDSGDIYMDNGVRIEVESEDIILETIKLEWKDETRILASGEDDEVTVSRDNGTSFTGLGLTANARTRDWEFAGIVHGTFISGDDEEDIDDKTERVVYEREIEDEQLDYLYEEDEEDEAEFEDTEETWEK